MPILKESWKKNCGGVNETSGLFSDYASRFTRKNLKRHLRKASSVSYTKKSSSIMKRTFISAFLLGGILAGTHLSAQETKPASTLKEGPNVSLNITNKKKFPPRT